MNNKVLERKLITVCFLGLLLSLFPSITYADVMPEPKDLALLSIIALMFAVAFIALLVITIVLVVKKLKK